MLKPGKTGHIKRITMTKALAFNSFQVGQQGPDLLRYHWVSADRRVQRTCSILVPSSVFPVSGAHCLPLHLFPLSFKACRARLYRQLVHEVLIAVYEAVAERVLRRTYALQAFPEYHCQAFFLAPLSSLSGLPSLPSPPLPRGDPRPPSLLFLPSLSESLSLFFSLSRLRVTGLLLWSLFFCVGRSVGNGLPCASDNDELPCASDHDLMPVIIMITMIMIIVQWK
jgi:hypothetical protein